MAARPDYDMTGTVPPPPPPTTPPPPSPPPPPPLSPAMAETVRDLQPPPQAQPEVMEVTVQLRRVVFVDGDREYPKGTREAQVAMRAIPDAGRPASESLDRLNAACQAKLQQYLQEMQ